MTRPSSQSGSAFFIILIAIFIFGALSYAMMQGSRTAQSGLSSEQARLAANEIISNGDNVQKTVQTLRLRGCTNAQINPGANPNAPTDNSCDIYNLAGGKATFYKLPENYHDPKFPYNTTDVSADASYNVEETPTETTDLVYYVKFIKKDICLSINKILEIETDTNGDPPAETLEAWWQDYDGTFKTGGNGIGDDSDAPHENHSSGCYGDSTSGYTYYHVLLAQ
ncbi:MAG: hypothetical protein DI551_04415 [Micavibrio aeruginosavorus]|uniref:Uncharacterized protein n=1 Tax=Micavibrio aeruginosavorus TaxID=349221 RepID=A0A2W5N2E3_9BACT|nr:MAG: hypothetical protein DI551_04415 [Micavibrio aeruginosavorus]